MSVLSSSYHVSEGAGLEALILLNCSSVESADLSLPSRGRLSALRSAPGPGPGPGQSSEALVRIIRTGLVAFLLLVGNKRRQLERETEVGHRYTVLSNCRGARAQHARTCTLMNSLRLMLSESRQLVLNRTLGSYSIPVCISSACCGLNATKCAVNCSSLFSAAALLCGTESVRFFTFTHLLFVV